MLTVPVHARAYFLGDSWTAGVSATEGRGFPQVASEMLGWRPTVDGVGGTGFLRTYVPGTDTIPVRAQKIRGGVTTDVVILEGGLNDQQSDLTPLESTIVKTVKTLRQKFPGAPIIVLGPGATSLPLTPVLARVDRIEKAAAGEAKAVYISPIEEHWFTEANIASLMDPATYHPNTVGHAYFGGRLALAIQRLETQPSSS